MKHISKFASFLLFPTSVFLVHLIAAFILDLYRIFPNLDIPFHYMGGLAIAYAATRVLSYLEKERVIPLLNIVVFLILIFSLTITAAVFWEFAEFIGDRLLDANIQVSLANTMQDQFMGALGGVTWTFIYYKKSRAVLRTAL